MMHLSRRLYLGLLTVLFAFNFSSAGSALTISNQKTVYLSGLEYELLFDAEDGQLPTAVSFKGGDRTIDVRLDSTAEGSFKTTVSFPAWGTWELYINGKAGSVEIWSVPGWFSLLPPLVAIALALITHQVLIALFAGIFIGALIIYGFNPLQGFVYSLSEFIAKAPADPDNMAILVFSLTLGGMVGVVSKNGGTQGIVEALSKYASDTRRGQIVTWAMGILIFFDDYANTLIVGNTMRPLTDRLKISREKLAYLVDSTAAPIATLAVISTWIGYQLSLIDEAFGATGLDMNAFVTFLQTIPFNFYPALALFFGFMIAFTGRDFSTMRAAEKRAWHENKVLADGATPLADTGSEEIMPREGVPLRWYNALVPVVMVIAVTFLGLWFTGLESLSQSDRNAGLLRYISAVFGNADSFSVLIWGAFAGSFTAIIMSLWQKLLSLNEAINAWVGGVKAMLIAGLILTLAWAIGDICVEVQTAGYVIEQTRDLLSPVWIPTLTFLIAGVVAFSTGTSWATMAILTPIVVPLAWHLPLADSAIGASQQSSIFLSSVAAILAGATFGDHCSPISDTTIMSSMASGSDHVDHVKTQLPYALVVGTVAVLFGFIPAGLGMHGLYLLPVGAIVLALFIRFAGKKTN